MTVAVTSLSAKTYRITRLNESPITIGGRQLVVNKTFDSADAIKWKSDNQVMQVVDTETGKSYVARKRVNRGAKSNMTIADFLVHTSNGSTRGTNGKGIPEFTRSEVSGDFPERRAALVIGNSNYSELAPLRNAQSDAVAVSDNLLSLGFDVMQLYECDGSDMKTALTEFCRNAGSYDFILFYYAGHGIQDEGHNYLVPVDKALEFKSELRDCLECDDVAQRFDAMSAESRMIILDACRNTKKTWSRSADEGLARMEPGRGSVILFSTESGRVAQDGEGDHSPFATALLDNITKPGVNFSDVINGVVRDTYNATAKKQYPMQMGALLSNFCFNSTGAASPAGVQTAQTSTVEPRRQPEARPQKPAYQQTKSVSTLEMRPIVTRVSGDKCIMEFVLVNTGRKLNEPFILDRESTYSQIFDSEGNQYPFNSFGGPYNCFRFGPLPAGIPVRKRLVIKEFDPSATALSVVHFNLRDTGNGAAYGCGQIEFKNVPIGLNEPFPNMQTGPANQVSITAADIDVKIKSASISGNVATINLLVTNNLGRHLEPNILREEPMTNYSYVTMAVDDKGNVILLDDIEFSPWQLSFPSGVPVKITVKIGNLDPEVRTLPFVGITMRNLDPDSSYGTAFLTLRNVEL